MPASAEEGRDVMMSWIRAQNPQSVLDIGTGNGTYGRLLRESVPRPYLIGVEVWDEYVPRFNLRDIYDHLIVQDVTDMAPEDWPKVDVVILGDVLEHMPYEDALSVWTIARQVARRGVYLSIPIIHYPQGPEHGNPYEEHLTQWTDERVQAAFPDIGWKWLGTIVGRYEALSSR